MADTKPEDKQNESGVPNALPETAYLRLPSTDFSLSPDNEKDGRKYEGSVSLKVSNTGDFRKDYFRIPYIDMKKIIDFCRENKDLFNKQLKQEREKLQVGDL
ncbi:hypothetical protein V7O62_12335 [Methanolobus sp. ZRKC2]|uniref:hypothetical protein n=1 Tax=Methanolobus sp. ZRKC2 TaxID=3125783 RepID=UPI00324BD646